jgi:hypothetical protein
MLLLNAFSIGIAIWMPDLNSQEISRLRFWSILAASATRTIMEHQGL